MKVKLNKKENYYISQIIEGCLNDTINDGGGSLGVEDAKKLWNKLIDKKIIDGLKHE